MGWVQARVTNTSRHLVTAVEVFASGDVPEATAFPAATAHSINLTTLPDRPEPADAALWTLRDGQQIDLGECGPVAMGLCVKHGMRAFLIRSGDKDWGVLYGATLAYACM